MHTRWLRTALVPLVALASVIGFAAPARAAVPDRVAFVLWDGAAVVASGTTPAGTSVTVIGTGRYQIKFPGQAAPGGVVHVTAINAAPHWCQAEAWFPSAGDEYVMVRCYRVSGALDFSGFSAFFTSSSGPGTGLYGYVDSNPSGATISQYNTTGAVNTVTHLATGQWSVGFPGIGSTGPRDGGLQATAVNAATGTHCNIASWSSTPAEQRAVVFCFTSSGAPLDTRFTLSYQQRVSLQGSAWPPKNFGYLWWMPGVGPATTNFNSQTGFGGNAAGLVGVGLISVKFTRLSIVPDNVQVTAYGTVPNWCSLSAIWTHLAPDTLVQNVNCFTVNGTPVNNAFLISDNSVL